MAQLLKAQPITGHILKWIWQQIWQLLVDLHIALVMDHVLWQDIHLQIILRGGCWHLLLILYMSQMSRYITGATVGFITKFFIWIILSFLLRVINDIIINVDKTKYMNCMIVMFIRHALTSCPHWSYYYIVWFLCNRDCIGDHL